jgi:hypothetical protein
VSSLYPSMFASLSRRLLLVPIVLCNYAWEEKKDIAYPFQPRCMRYLQSFSYKDNLGFVVDGVLSVG